MKVVAVILEAAECALHLALFHMLWKAKSMVFAHAEIAQPGTAMLSSGACRAMHKLSPIVDKWRRLRPSCKPLPQRALHGRNLNGDSPARSPSRSAGRWHVRAALTTLLAPTAPGPDELRKGGGLRLEIHHQAHRAIPF